MDFYAPIHLLFGECVYRVPVRDFAALAGSFSKDRVVFRAGPPSDGAVTLKVPLMAAERAEKAALAAGIALAPEAKRGLPFVFMRYIRRTGLIVGTFAALALIFTLRLFVWDVEISGNTGVPEGDILRGLAAAGVAPGAFIPDIDPAVCANDLLLNCGSLSSATVTVKGVRVLVNVLERSAIPPITDTGGYYYVVASRDGVILDVDAADGTPAVRPGDVVTAGELLINSFVEGKYGTYRPTHARGVVLAEVHEHFETAVPLERVTKVYTGRSETRTTLTLFGGDFDLFVSGDPPYEYFDALSTRRETKLFGFIRLPAETSSVTYYEYVPTAVPIDFAAAETCARQELRNYLDGLGLEVVGCEVTVGFDEENGACLLKADAVVIDDICKEVEFDIIDYGNIFARLPIARE